MKWTDEFAVGIPAIDDQHKTIFGMCDKYLQDLSNGDGEAAFGDFLDSLISYCDAHFGFEETCMQIYKCPFAEKNKEQHLAFSAAIKKFKARFEANGFNSVDSHLLAKTTQDWLALHICKTDRNLGESARKHPLE